MSSYKIDCSEQLTTENDHTKEIVHKKTITLSNLEKEKQITNQKMFVCIFVFANGNKKIKL